MAMLAFYQFPGPWDVCSASPFCAKLEAFMRWQDIAYKPVTVTNMKGAPKGKIPFIEDENGKLGDSDFIIEYLIKKHNLNPDETLTPEQKGQGRAIRYLCEESIYRAMVHFRWLDPQGWGIMRERFFSKIPAFIRPVAEWKIQGYVRKQLHMQGMGRHSPDEIAAIACGDLKVLSDILGNKPFIFGDSMTTADLVVFSVFANFTTGPFENPVTQYAKTLGNLMAHADRIRARCFKAESKEYGKQAA